VLIIDIIVKVVLNYYVRFSKAVTSLYNLYLECFCTPSKDTRKHSIELFFLDIYLLTDTKEDLNLIIKQVVRIASVFITIVLELRELRNYISAKLIIIGLA
jgi:hypothetical protein